MPSVSASWVLRGAIGRPSRRQRAAVGRDGAADDLDQRGLAGAVLADQAEDRARTRPRGSRI